MCVIGWAGEIPVQHRGLATNQARRRTGATAPRGLQRP
ncbi:hypothetical protein SZ55_1912 [Pseudomonas sp. FeS53a]|nr:hypothetical protein SZ55_1912 [Pseudomonas sp. FeS53a]